MALSSSRILVCYSIWTDSSKFGLILDFSKIRFKDEDHFDKHIGVENWCRVQRDSKIYCMNLSIFFWKTTKIYLISNFYGNSLLLRTGKVPYVTKFDCVGLSAVTVEAVIVYI